MSKCLECRTEDEHLESLGVSILFGVSKAVKIFCRFQCLIEWVDQYNCKETGKVTPRCENLISFGVRCGNLADKLVELDTIHNAEILNPITYLCNECMDGPKYRIRRDLGK